MKKTITIFCVFLIAAGLFALKSCSNNKGSYGTTTPADSCLAPTSWFPHSQTPAPEEGSNSPFANPATTSNCDFHLWAWQKFLFLTRTGANQKANFENLRQVNNEMDTLGSMLILDDTTQAGSGSTLYDKSRKPIYYAIYLNDEMYNHSTKYIKLFIDSCKTNDTTLNQATLNKLGYNTVTFPVGAFEVKTSWMFASDLSPSEKVNYYITHGKMKTTGEIKEVALLAMHIIGRVQNHPEFIWATYEHSNLAPTVKWPANYATDSIPDSTQTWTTGSLFYNSGDSMKAMGIRRGSSPNAGRPNTFLSTYHVYDHGTQPAYTNIILKDKDKENLNNIEMLNQSVYNQLKKENDMWQNYAYVGSTWIDPTTVTNGQLDTLTPGDGNIGALDRFNLRGSRAITNVTMETYAQLEFNFLNTSPPPITQGYTTPGNSMNCFGCHATVNFKVNQANNGPGAFYDMGLSHLFNNRLAALLKAPPVIKKKK